MKERILTYLFAFTGLLTYAQDSCAVKVCLNDCLNCYGNFVSVENLGDSVSKTLLFPSIPEKEAEYYAKNLLHVKDLKRYNIVLSDSLYNQVQKTITSEIVYYKGNKEVLHENLDKFHIQKIKKQEEDTLIIISLPDSVFFSQSVNLLHDSGYFLITDYRFGKIVLIDENNPEKIRIINARDLTTNSIFQIITKNDSSYTIFKKYANYLKYANFDKIRFEPCRKCKNNLSVFITVPDIKFINNNLHVLSATGIINFIDFNKFDILSYNNKSLPQNYYINSSSYYTNKNNYYLPVSKLDSSESSKNYCIAKFKNTNNDLTFDSFVPFELPKEYKQLKDLMVIPVFIYPYVFYQYSLSVFNLETNKTETLPLTPQKLNIRFDMKNKKFISNEYTYAFSDAVIEGNNLYVLYYDTTSKYLLTVDTNTFSKKSLKKLAHLKYKAKSPYYLYDKEHIYYFSKNNEIVVEKARFIEK